jgi:hypothetical protein
MTGTRTARATPTWIRPSRPPSHQVARCHRRMRWRTRSVTRRNAKRCWETNYYGTVFEADLKPLCRSLLPNSPLTSSAASSPHGCPSPNTRGTLRTVKGADKRLAGWHLASRRRARPPTSGTAAASHNLCCHGHARRGVPVPRELRVARCRFRIPWSRARRGRPRQRLSSHCRYSANGRDLQICAVRCRMAPSSTVRKLPR